PFVLEINYEVGNGLRLRARISNSGNATMPFGFGAHPYFHAPLDPRGSRSAISVQLDADSRWPLDASMIPSAPPVPLAGKYDLRVRRPLGAETFDDAFRTRPVADVSAPRARMIDPSLNLAIEVRADP